MNRPGPCPQEAQSTGREDSQHLQSDMTRVSQRGAQKEGYFTWLIGRHVGKGVLEGLTFE